MGRVLEERLSFYMVFVSTDSKSRQQGKQHLHDPTQIF